MNLPELCIRRPVMTTLLMAVLMLFGVLSYGLLPISELPRVDFPTIQVTVSLPGASPETMASTVATPLEGQFGTIAGLDSITSVSATGQTQITLTFALNRDIDAAAQDVQSAMTVAQRLLPPEINPPSFRKVNPADQPIFYVAMYSPSLPLSRVNEYAETQLAQRLSTVKGVAQVSVFGAQKYAVRIQLDPTRVAATGLGMDEIQQAITAGNVNKPTGYLENRQQALSINADGQLRTAAAWREFVVAYRNGSPVRLDALARVIDSVENARVSNWFDGKRSIVLAVQRQPGTNTVETVNAIREILPRFAASLPNAVQMEVVYDRSESIRDSIREVRFTLILAAVLVVLVIFVFLRNFSATLIPAAALPVSVIGTFGAMYLLDYSLDNLSLLALTLAVGFVVDDAIVMLENIVRHIEEGMPPYEAALLGSREIGFTIISMTLSLVAVFIPLLFMGGMVGRLLHEFAVVISVSILISAFVSLTLTPMLCSRFLKAHSAHDPLSHTLGTAKEGVRGGWRVVYAGWLRMYHGLLRGFEIGFNAVFSLYKYSLLWAMRHRSFILVVFIFTLLGSGFLYTRTPKDFLPPGDTGQLIGFIEGGQDISFSAMVGLQSQIAERVAADPSVLLVNSFVGGGGRITTNSGTVFVRIRPAPERQYKKPDQIIQDLRKRVADIPGVRVVFQNPPPIRIGGLLTAAQYQYTLQSGDLDELYAWSGRLLTRLRQMPDLQDVSTTLQNNAPTISLQIDRDKLAILGLSLSQVQEALNTGYAVRQVSTIYGSSAQYPVIVEVAPEFRNNPDSLRQIYVRSATQGKLIPLDTVVKIVRKNQALTVNHQGQLPSVTLSFNLAPGIALGTAADKIHALETEMNWPATISGNFTGTAQVFEESTRNLGWLLLIAIVVIYVVLGILYESFIHPLTILSGLPSASLGALATLLVFGIDLSLYAFVGVILLVGIVKKNAIMMIDFAVEAERQRGVSSYDAIVEACLIRFRPIMMTTVAAFAGILPVAIGLGPGAESRTPLGIAVVGGLLVSQFITLYLTPVIYTYMHRFTRPDTAGGKMPSAVVSPSSVNQALIPTAHPAP